MALSDVKSVTLHHVSPGALFCKCTNKCKLPCLLSTVKAGSNTISADVVPAAPGTHEIPAQETAAMEAKSKMR